MSIISALRNISGKREGEGAIAHMQQLLRWMMHGAPGRTDGIWVILLAAPNRHVEGYRVTHLLAD